MGLLAPLFLAGLAALAIPLWIHMMNRSNPPAQPFSSVFLLKHSEQITSSERSLRYWLLLALRLLALLALVLLFAQPVTRDLAPAASGPGESNALILIDRSLSMATDDRWESARDQAMNLLDDLPAGTSVQVIAASDRLERVQESTTDLTAVRNTIARLRPERGELNLGALIAAADDIASGLSGNTHIHLFSDMQASNLPPRFSDLVPSSAPMQLHPAGTQSTNFSLTAWWEGSNIMARVDQHAAGDSRLDVPDLSLDLLVDDQLLSSIPMQDEGDGAWSATFSEPALPRDTRALELRFELDDSLQADNRFFLAPPAANSIRALILASNASLEDSLYLRTALQSLSDPRVEVDVQYAGGGVNFAIDDYEIALVSDAGVLSENMVQALGSWVERGGNLVLVAGSRVTTGETIPLAGGRLQTANGNENQGLLINNSRHPAFSRFPANSLAAQLYRPRQLAGFSGNLLVQTSAGWPWMVEQPQGAGRILLLAHSLTPAASNLSLQPEFVPLLRSLVSWMAEINRLPRHIETGDRILLGQANGADPAAGPVIQQLFLTNGLPLLGLGEQGQQRTFRVDEPGIYGLQTASGLHLAAANLPLGEVNPTSIEPALLQRWRNLASGEDIQAVDVTAVTGESAPVLPEWKSWEHWLIPILLALLLAEALIANLHLRVRRETS